MKEKILSVSFGIVVIIGLLFLFYRFISSLNMLELLKSNSTIIEALAGIGTLISSIVAVLTIYEVKLQRQHTYKPDVYLDSYTARVYPVKYWEKNEFFEYKSGKYNEPVKSEEGVKGIHLTYSLTNLGFGVAKNIVCEWEFDTMKALNVLKGMLPSEFNIDTAYNGYALKKGDLYLDFLRIDDIKAQSTDFILPENVKENKKSSSVPHVITLLYTYYVVFKYTLYDLDPDNEFLYEDFPDLPFPKLKLTYYDLAKKRHFKKLDIKLVACSTLNSKNVDIDNEADFGIFYIEVSES